jgi:hypothetical protein
LKWHKRRKILKISNLLIPLSLAGSLVFAGFSVFADEAQNFVVRIKDNDGINLALSINEDLSNQTAKLLIPTTGNFTGATFDPATGTLSNVYGTSYSINDVTSSLGASSVKDRSGDLIYSAYTFYLINNSERAVDVDVAFTFDALVSNGNEVGYHIDDALRIMFVEGDAPLSENKNAYTIYAKHEQTEEEDNQLKENTKYYDDVEYFLSSDTVFERTDDNAILNLAVGECRKFTIVLWLEGEDVACNDVLFGEMIKMSVNFAGK